MAELTEPTADGIPMQMDGSFPGKMNGYGDGKMWPYRTVQRLEMGCVQDTIDIWYNIVIRNNELMMKCASFFAGVGGIDQGFENTGFFQTIYANEFDKYPAETYELNHDIKVDTTDIRKVEAESLPDFDVLLAGFPCQAFSIAGLREGFADVKGRGELFFELVRIMQVKKPRIAFFENVKNLVNHDNGNTFRVISSTLQELGYHMTYKVLNAMYYGNIPQNRERIYMVAFRDEDDYNAFTWPKSVIRTKTVRDVIDFDSTVDEKYYYREGKYKGQIYEKLVEAMADDDINDPAIYQWRRVYVRKNKAGVVPTLTANQGGGGHNVCLVKTANGIRKMTPRECFNTQGFSKDFKLPLQSDARLYKQAGNSVAVTVIQAIAEQIVAAVSKTAEARQSESLSS